MPDHTTAPSPVASVLADLGPGVGALVVRTTSALAGREIEIEAPGRRPTHVAVRERRLPGGRMWAAFFPTLPAGAYALHLVGDPQRVPVTVRGGRVNELTW